MDTIADMSLRAHVSVVKTLNPKQFQDGLRRALTGRQPDPARRLPTRWLRGGREDRLMTSIKP